MNALSAELAHANRMGVADAKARFSHVIDAAEKHGELTVIMRYGRPVAVISPVPQKPPRSVRAKGKLATYADGQKRELESSAFARAMVNKHAGAS